jgi:hypothetical protein
VSPRDSDWHAVAEAFRRRDDVRLNIPILDAEPFLAGASPGSLHFVSNEEAAVLARDLNCAFEVTRQAAR